MKKFLLTAVLGMFALAGFSQLKWDAKVGMSMTNITQVDMDMKVGYTLGVGMDYAFSDMWSLQSGLNFTSKGAKDSYEEEGVKVNYKECSHYLDIPILAVAKLNLSDNIKFVVNAGSYFSFGLGGKATYNVEYNGENLNLEELGLGDSKLFSKEEGVGEALMKRFDMGLQYGVGLEIKEHYLVNITGQNAFTQVYNGNWVDGKNKKIHPKNMAFMISVGYRF